MPWPDAPWWEVRRLNGIFGDRAAGVRRADRRVGSCSRNAASCVRRSVWLDHPFTLPAAEDLDWAKRMVDDSYFIVYDPSIAVYHSHDEGPARRHCG